MKALTKLNMWGPSSLYTNNNGTENKENDNQVLELTQWRKQEKGAPECFLHSSCNSGNADERETWLKKRMVEDGFQESKDPFPRKLLQDRS